ncbi:MAG: hypothetical protein CMF41_04250 [Legionellales bacterium]|nr:hypothetical protein [Legionellales bacterium]
MIRVRMKGRFPSDMQAGHMKACLRNIVHLFLGENHYLPSENAIQSEICRVLGVQRRDCVMIMYMFMWISVDEEIRTVMNRSMSENNNIKKKKLTKKQKDGFKSLKVKKCKGPCTICLGENFKGVKLPCGHEFHKSCIKKSFSYNKKCPNCRKEIKL